MPRQIIDTESGRPAYQRRRIATFIVGIVIAAALAAVGWAFWSHHAALPGNFVH